MLGLCFPRHETKLSKMYTTTTITAIDINTNISLRSIRHERKEIFHTFIDSKLNYKGL